MRSHPLWTLSTTRLAQFFREPGAVFWTFGFPLLVTVALGLAFRSQGVPKSDVVVVAEGRGGEVAQVLSKQPRLFVRSLPRAEAEAELHAGKVALVVDAPLDATGPIRYRYDPARPDALPLRQAVDDALQRAAGRADVVGTHDEVTVAEGERYVDWLVPGLMGMQVMQGSLWGVGFVVVNARQRKLLKRLAATPMRRSHYLLALIVGALSFIPIEVTVLFLFARLAFGVVVHGSYWGLLATALLGSFCFSGIGLACAARAQNSETANGLINLVTLPMFVLSGVFFSAARFPEFLQPLIQALPLTALNDLLRTVVNAGHPLWAKPVDVCVLLAWSALGFVFALRTFRWT